jgi:sec-independent protein translocase protein TatB
MMVDLSFEKLLVIGVIALFLVGPQRLPQIAAQLARWVKIAQAMTRDAKERLREEVGDDVDLEALDPRRYDPRRIIREALLDVPELAPIPTAAPEEPRDPALQQGRAGARAFDDEAT